MFKQKNLNNCTKLYRKGTPFVTGALSNKSAKLLEDAAFNNTNKIDYFKAQELDNGSLTLTYKLGINDKTYGLGETVGPFNKRGKIYRLYASDDPCHTPDKEFLYSSHPFLIIEGKSNTFGIFIDYPSQLIFDIGFTVSDTLEITIPAPTVKTEKANSTALDIYIFDSADKLAIVKEYLLLTGTPYIVPKWAFGYQQSRWSYPDAKTILDVANKFRQLKIPCDAIYMDIDYMDNFKVFTIDDNKFPDFKSFVNRLKSMGFKLIPIIDPGVKIEKGYKVYEEGIKSGCFCVNEKGQNFEAAVWPGLTHFPDFLRKDVRLWWSKLYEILISCDIEGVWNDMNEPSIFYTQEAIDEIYNMLETMKKTGNFDKWTLTNKAAHISNRREYYQEFCHIDDKGNKINHDNIHNLYGFYMTLAAADGFKTLMPKKRYFLLTRSCYSGAHRFTALWTGDNHSWWEHMLSHIQMVMSLNLSGFFYTGADICGFGGNASEELAIRWMQLGIFTPLYRNHSAYGSRHQEPWAFSDRATDIFRNIIRLRYALIPYSYSEFMHCVKELLPFVTPLMFLYDVHDIEDQFMYGRSLMAAPIHSPNACGRYVYLPKHKWLLWRASSFENRIMKVYEPGVYYINADISEIPVFIKENALIALTAPSLYVTEKDTDTIIITGLVSSEASFTYYEDDGITYDYEKGIFSTVSITVIKHNSQCKALFEIGETEKHPLKLKTIELDIYDEQGFFYTLSIQLDGLKVRKSFLLHRFEKH
ncbi:family 31 glycosyl hydrolase, alpha-glucosidase [Candidatus Magnetoovum chiemensis]|nr:family 31 glycosyl hydrolase, alpha-glucosidase [Candidatus Magnetoovum chiemensis]